MFYTIFPHSIYLISANRRLQNIDFIYVLCFFFPYSKGGLALLKNDFHVKLMIVDGDKF